MKRVHRFHRKKPHLLPPLMSSQHSSPRSVGALQPPDLLLTKNRFGSPIPRPKNPREFDYVTNESNDKPKIRIEEANKTESEGCNLMKFDLLSGPIFGKTDNLLHQVREDNIPEMRESESAGGKEKNLLFRSLSIKKLDKPPGYLEKNIKFQKILPLEEPKTTKIYPQIPNRYKPLKPIGEGKNED